MDFAEVCALEVRDILFFAPNPSDSVFTSRSAERAGEGRRKMQRRFRDWEQSCKNRESIMRAGSIRGISIINQADLAGLAVELRVKIRSADMPVLLQEKALRLASDALRSSPKPLFRPVAASLKKEFDQCYGPAWHCIVGTSFGSLVTHSAEGFLYFSIDKIYVLLFKTTVHPI